MIRKLLSKWKKKKFPYQKDFHKITVPEGIFPLLSAVPSSK